MYQEPLVLDLTLRLVAVVVVAFGASFLGRPRGLGRHRDVDGMTESSIVVMNEEVVKM